MDGWMDGWMDGSIDFTKISNVYLDVSKNGRGRYPGHMLPTIYTKYIT